MCPVVCHALCYPVEGHQEVRSVDDQERAAIRTTRDKFVADRQKLDMMIAMLSEQLGEPPPGGGGGLPMGFASSGGGGGGGDPVAGTREGEFFGFTSTKAAGEILRKYGSRQRPLKTKQIYDAIRKGGVDISSEEGFYRSLARSRNFRKVARGTWGLSEWYPPVSKKAADAANVATIADPDEVDDDLDAEEEVPGA